MFILTGNEIKSNLNLGYAGISRVWKKGDKVVLVLPMKVHKITVNGRIEEDRNKTAFENAPVVYCAEEIDNENISKIKIPANFEINIEPEKVLSEKVFALKLKYGDEESKLIPYYVWSNRIACKMKVWILRQKES